MDSSQALTYVGVIIFIGFYIALNVGVIYFAMTLFPSDKKKKKIDEEWVDYKRKIARQRQREETRAREEEARSRASRPVDEERRPPE